MRKADEVRSASFALPAVRGTFVRHDWCWLTTDAIHRWDEIAILTADLHSVHEQNRIDRCHDVISEWIRMDRPLVVTRQSDSQTSDRLRVAICRPRDFMPRRFHLEIPTSMISRTGNAVKLCELMTIAPISWMDGFESLAGRANDLQLDLHVFGSWAWSWRTGLSYIHTESDLDLILDLSPTMWSEGITADGSLQGRLAELREAISRVAFRCDVEVRVHRNAACSLTEMSHSARTVLVKWNDRNTLVPRPELRALAC